MFVMMHKALTNSESDCLKGCLFFDNFAHDFNALKETPSGPVINFGNNSCWKLKKQPYQILSGHRTSC